MPKSHLQEIVFTLLMIFIMVYAMICYNIAINAGEMTNQVFLSAFNKLYILGPIAFVLDFFLVSRLSKKLTLRIFSPEKDNPFFITLSISCISVLFMCPLMSLTDTILFKDAGVQIIAVWLQTTVINFPMALLWQIFFAGPVVRHLFTLLLKGYNAIVSRIRRSRKNLQAEKKSS